MSERYMAKSKLKHDDVNVNLTFYFEFCYMCEGLSGQKKQTTESSKHFFQ